MGILSALLGGKKKTSASQAKTSKPTPSKSSQTKSKPSTSSGNSTLSRLEQQTKHADAEIALLQAADRQFENDKDLDKRIAAYESVFHKKTHWNSFNYCMKLVKMYEDAEKNNKAWSLLNKMIGWFATYPNPAAYIPKIRKEQFKILKKEKKYDEALRWLLAAHASFAKNPSEFNAERFISEAKTTAKGLGMTEEQLQELAEIVQKTLRQSNGAEKVDEAYQAFLSANGLRK